MNTTRRPMLFSERKGLKNVREGIQRDSMDDDLRKGLWNSVFSHILEPLRDEMGIEMGMDFFFKGSKTYHLFRKYWSDLYKKPLNKSPKSFDKFVEAIHNEYRSNHRGWNEAYDFIEFAARNCPKRLLKKFVESCNQTLEKEMSAYRLVNCMIIDLTSEEEIESIEEAINSSNQYSGVKNHIEAALRYFSDRESPDYRNSVKESISAVESLCKSITGNDKATLGKTLNQIEKDYRIHKAFKNALSSLYGYTSAEGGIRHALLEESKISHSDAKFMLVLCSAFVNYILGKESEKTTNDALD